MAVNFGKFLLYMTLGLCVCFFACNLVKCLKSP